MKKGKTGEVADVVWTDMTDPRLSDHLTLTEKKTNRHNQVVGQSDRQTHCHASLAQVTDRYGVGLPFGSYPCRYLFGTKQPAQSRRGYPQSNALVPGCLRGIVPIHTDPFKGRNIIPAFLFHTVALLQ